MGHVRRISKPDCCVMHFECEGFTAVHVLHPLPVMYSHWHNQRGQAPFLLAKSMLAFAPLLFVRAAITFAECGMYSCCRSCHFSIVATLMIFNVFSDIRF